MVEKVKKNFKMHFLAAAVLIKINLYVRSISRIDDVKMVGRFSIVVNVYKISLFKLISLHILRFISEIVIEIFAAKLVQH